MNTCPLTNPTFQEVFDFSFEKILEQGKPSFDVNDLACMYRGPGDTKCVVGHMLGDDVDFTELHGLNGVGVGRLVESKALPESYSWMAEDNMLGLLAALQTCHDEAAAYAHRHGGNFIELFKKKMEARAYEYHLTYKEPA